MISQLNVTSLDFFYKNPRYLLNTTLQTSLLHIHGIVSVLFHVKRFSVRITLIARGIENHSSFLSERKVFRIREWRFKWNNTIFFYNPKRIPVFFHLGENKIFKKALFLCWCVFLGLIFFFNLWWSDLFTSNAKSSLEELIMWKAVKCIEINKMVTCILMYISNK